MYVKIYYNIMHLWNFITGRDNFVENLDFEGIPVKELIDPTLANWVHHVQHILPQVSSLEIYNRL